MLFSQVMAYSTEIIMGIIGISTLAVYLRIKGLRLFDTAVIAVFALAVIAKVSGLY